MVSVRLLRRSSDESAGLMSSAERTSGYLTRMPYLRADDGSFGMFIVPLMSQESLNQT